MAEDFTINIMKNIHTKPRKKNRRKPYALLMISVSGWEIQRHAPPNWYEWSRRAKTKWLLKRWPDATGVVNGDPINPQFFYIH